MKLNKPGIPPAVDHRLWQRWFAHAYAAEDQVRQLGDDATERQLADNSLAAKVREVLDAESG